mmetsp:Transcript_22992/g.49628  ORF Transcript_22992/g.49628 Transcript_22992/m.49628 type:complete len:108 (+) Transcript_22992:343-666(+)
MRTEMRFRVSKPITIGEFDQSGRKARAAQAFCHVAQLLVCAHQIDTRSDTCYELLLRSLWQIKLECAQCTAAAHHWGRATLRQEAPGSEPAAAPDLNGLESVRRIVA